MHAAHKPRPVRSWAERQLKKREQESEGVKAYAEYRSKQASALANMQRLRALRLSRDHRHRVDGSAA